MDQLKDFYRGDTKRWRADFPVDIAGSTIKFRMAKSLAQGAPDLEIVGLMDDPDGGGLIFGATMEISAAQSATLDAGDYFAEHEITDAASDVTTFLPQRINVMAGVPRG